MDVFFPLTTLINTSDGWVKQASDRARQRHEPPAACFISEDERFICFPSEGWAESTGRRLELEFRLRVFPLLYSYCIQLFGLDWPARRKEWKRGGRKKKRWKLKWSGVKTRAALQCKVGLNLSTAVVTARSEHGRKKTEEEERLRSNSFLRPLTTALLLNWQKMIKNEKWSASHWNVSDLNWSARLFSTQQKAGRGINGRCESTGCLDA